ncbi:MAG: DUF2157 domain-containing protein [Sphingomonadales bacterium]|jgi:uncharacterized membrane protein
MNDQRMTLKDIDALVAQGELSGKAYWLAVRTIRDGHVWKRWGLMAIFALAIAHLGAAISLFIAANWNIIGPFTKLIGAGGLIIATGLFAFFHGLDTKWGQASLIFSQLLVGLWLVVFSQIYQTGADHYQLFLTWALLILPWTLVSANQASWVVFLTITVIGLWLYSYQHISLNGIATVSTMTATITLLLTGVLSFAEGARLRGAEWLTPQWGRLLCLAAIIAHADYMTIRLLVMDNSGGMMRIVFAAFALLYLTILYWNAKRGLAPFGLTVLGWGVFVAAHAMWLVAKLSTDWIVLSLFAAIMITTTASMAWVFSKVQKGRSGA